MINKDTLYQMEYFHGRGYFFVLEIGVLFYVIILWLLSVICPKFGLKWLEGTFIYPSVKSG